MSSIAESLKEAEAILADSDVAEPRREAQSLVMLATGRDKTFLYACPDHRLTSDEIASLDSFIQRRANREPLQYISGVQEFYGLEFEVTRDVLIPRPETEMVVEQALEILRASATCSVCDVGTGSGCIVVSILHELARSDGTALDASTSALRVARRNADKHGVADRLELLESDVFSSLDDKK